MLPDYPKFKKLEIEDIFQISQYLKKYAPNICELALANLLIWKDFDKPQLTLIRHNLCLLISPPKGEPFFLEPIGNHKPEETIAVCLKHSGKISRASESFIKELPHNNYRITCLRNQFDYVYSTKVLAELKGKKIDGKRNHVKRFKERHPNHEYAPLDASLKTRALELFEAWFDRKKEFRYFPKLAYISQRKAVETAFSHFDELGLVGGAVLEEKEMKGFILGSKSNPGMISVHFQYGDPSLRGISQVLLREACRKTFSSFKELNLEQDLGIPGLRKAKLSYSPLRLEKKFEVRPTQK
jgi:hypothetical protein